MFYMLGFGPFVALANKWNMSGRRRSWGWVIEVGGFIYAPLWQLQRHGPEPICETLGSYTRFWCHILIDEPPFDK